jgi:DNA-binding MarR family transcriptional regulator
MTEQRTENMVGALALALSDALLHGASLQAPEPGQAAAAITLLRHEPGMPIETLRRALGLSHPGTVRLVDRLATGGLVERRPSARDGRAVALYLTEAGERSCTAILATRLEHVTRALAVLDPEERRAFGVLTEKLLASLVRNEEHAYSVCRLCDTEACADCPVTDTLRGIV